MKLAKFAKQVEKGAYVKLWLSPDGEPAFLASAYAAFLVTKFPAIKDADQLATVLDIPPEKWEGVCAEIGRMNGHMLDMLDMRDNVPDEKIAVRRSFGIEDGIIVTDGQDQRVTFIDTALLAPIQDEMRKHEEQITYWRRETKNGMPYIVIKEGMFLAGAVMPAQRLDEEYLAGLAELQDLCISEYERQKGRKAGGALPGDHFKEFREV